jgi:hypothetical protein
MYKFVTIFTLLLSAASAYACPDSWPCKRSGWSGFAGSVEIYEVGYYFNNSSEEMYTIRGYMMSNPTLNSIVTTAYNHWDKVNVSPESAQIYLSFISAFLPKMDELINNTQNNHGILIDEALYNDIQAIFQQHEQISDPEFITMKNSFSNVVEQLRGANYQQVRSWMNNEW